MGGKGGGGWGGGGGGVGQGEWLTFRPLPYAALATLKPQAGLITPQALPASQPSVVSDAHLGRSWILPISCVLVLTVSCLHFQGAGGEPMETNELVGMTPEIIQKVRLYSGFPLSLMSHICNHLQLKVD